MHAALQILLDAMQMNVLAEVLAETAGVQPDVGSVLD